MVVKKIVLHDKMVITDSVVYRGRTDMADIYLKETERRVKKARDAFMITKDAERKEISNALWDEKNNSLYAIILSVFSLEAHINRIGHDKLKSDEWKKRKKGFIRDKWYDFPNLINNKTFDKNSKLWKDFDEIVNLRNYLVHFKDYDYKEFVKHPCGKKVEGIYEHINWNNAEKAYNTSINMIKELDKLLK